MLLVTSRKVGNSVSISIPSELNPKIGQQYLIYKSKNGSLTLVPKIKNPFKDENSIFVDDNDQNTAMLEEKASFN